MKILILSIGMTYAFIPLDSVLLGEKLKGSYDTNPITYVFRPKSKLPDRRSKGQLMTYLGAVQAGRALQNKCHGHPPVYYRSGEKGMALRSMASTLQYVGLNIVTRAIAGYTQYFRFTPGEVKKLGQSLMPYCSKNITTIGRRQLEKNFYYEMKKNNERSIPKFELLGFNARVGLTKFSHVGKMREFVLTLDLFRSLCSWHGRDDNFRIMVPLLNDPVVMGFVIREMMGQRIKWHPRYNYTIEDNQKSTKVACLDLLCRKMGNVDFKRKMVRSQTGKDLKWELEALYCHEFRGMGYKLRDQVPELIPIIRGRDLDRDRLLASQLTSLWTGLPDLIIRTGNFYRVKNMVMETNIEEWQDWFRSLSNYSLEIGTYEVPLTMAIYHPDYPEESQFTLHIKVSQGEFDKSYETLGKIRTKNVIEFPISFLRWIRFKWKNRDIKKPRQVKKIVNIMRTHLEDAFELFRSKQVDPSVYKGIPHLVAKELLEQLEGDDGEFFRKKTEGTVEIPVYFYYGPFALQYLSFRKLAKLTKAEPDVNQR